MTASVQQTSPPGHCAACIFRSRPVYFEEGVVDIDRVQALRRGTRSVRRRSSLYLEGASLREYMTLYDGWAFSYRVLPSGARQILSFLIPGDDLGPSALIEDCLPYSVDTLTECTVCIFDREEMRAHVAAHDALCCKALRMSRDSSSNLARHLSEVARRTAYERIVYLVADLHRRLAARDLVAGPRIPFPPRQAHVADALGLTAIHVSRVFRELAEDGVLRHVGRAIDILDMDRVQQLYRGGGSPPDWT